MPMILRGSPMSPFARKVRMAILHLGPSGKAKMQDRHAHLAKIGRAHV